MNEHLTDLLGLYLDGELSGMRLRRVEDHLAICSACRSEMVKLQSLSHLLRVTGSTGNFTPTERFVSNMALQIEAATPRLAGHPARTTRRGRSEWALYLIPAGVLVAWIFFQSYLTISPWVTAVVAAGGSVNLAAWLNSGFPQSTWFTATLGLFGNVLTGQPRTVAGALDVLSVIGAQYSAQLVPQVVIGLVYWAWLAAWWRRNKPSRVDSEAINLLSHS